MDNNASNKPNNPMPNKPGGMKPVKFNLSWIYGIIIVLLLGSYFFNDKAIAKDVPYSTFVSYVNEGIVENITVFANKNTLEAVVNKSALKKVFGKDAELYEKDRKIFVNIPPGDEFTKFINAAMADKTFTGVVDYKVSRDYLEMFLYSFLPFLLIILFFVYMSRRMSGQMGGGSGGIFNVGKFLWMKK